MRWIRFQSHHGGGPRVGVLTDRGIHDLAASGAEQLSEPARRALAEGDMVTWIAREEEWRPRIGELVDRAPVLPLGDVRILAPIARPPKNIICVGLNYAAHAMESARALGRQGTVPEHPVFFTKPHTAIIGPEDEIRFDPAITSRVDYEGELAVVIGRGGRNIPKDRAWEHVFGFTLMNDVSARDLQRLHGQYFKGKSLDTFAPLGPVVVDRHDVPDLGALRLQTYVNGELRQDATPADMVFDVPTLIHVLSQGLTLEPGDILATGTPEGVGMGFDPPRFLQDGDVVEVRVDAIGTLRNRVRAVRSS